LKINLHFVPAGGTDRYQPLGRVVFGASKVTAQGEYRRFVHNDPECPTKTKDAVAMLVHACNHLSSRTVQSVWDIFQHPDIGDESSNEDES
jgi:hypothetical protein